MKPCRVLAHFLPVLVSVIAFSGLYAQARNEDGWSETGDSAVAERYFLWAERAASGGRWPEALTAIERAADFADVSSDISCLLALARSHEQKSRGAVLEALGRAFAVDRWSRYSPSQARLLEAEQLITLRNYAGALTLLDQVQEDPLSASASPISGFPPDPAALRLAVLKGLSEESAGTMFGTGGSPPAVVEFRRCMTETLDHYPRDPRYPRIFFDYARNRNPDRGDLDIMDLALMRLPLLLDSDPELAWMAAPFIRDTEEARRLMAAYRAGGLGAERNDKFRPNPASVTVSLKLGLIGEEEAVAELFALSEDSTGRPVPDKGLVIEKDLIVALSDLLQGDAGRNLLAEKLLSFSGLIIADDDRDGYPESRVLYAGGTIQEYSHDADQDGLAELVVSFDAGGGPQWASQAMLPETEADRAGLSALPLNDADRSKALIFWEPYPSVKRAELGKTAFIPRSGDFQFTPIHFTELAGNRSYAGLLFPLRQYSRLTLRTLVSFSLIIQRPSVEFEGAQEKIDLDRGIPLRAVEILDGRPVSITEFENGKPVLQWLDMDLDARMETVRWFRRFEYEGAAPLDYKKVVERTESDWDGDGIYETVEEYGEGGSVMYSWDMDKDGIKEYIEIQNGK